MNINFKDFYTLAWGVVKVTGVRIYVYYSTFSHQYDILLGNINADTCFI